MRLLGNGDPDEPTDRERVTVEEELDRRLGRDDPSSCCPSPLDP
jgi:hypothetical protein